MNEKEVGELRRRLRREKCGINHIYGCYVSEMGEILSTFDQSLALMPEEEQDKYLALMKKVLSGSLSRQLSDIVFTAKQVMDSDEHRLLTSLRQSALQDEEARQALYEKIIGSMSMGVNYVILLAADAYDVPFRSKDGAMQRDAGDEQFRFFLCAVCPVKMTKPALCYDPEQKQFHERGAGWAIAPPEAGFLFPAFDDRRTNLYGALYYCRSASADYSELVDAVFHTPAPMPPATQAETFRDVLAQSLAEECSFEVVQAVHEQMSCLIAAHKESREPEPLTINCRTVDEMLKESGVSPERTEAFGKEFETAFGADGVLSPRNLVDTKRVEIRTPDVVIQVNPERRELVQTRMLGGVSCIVIQADEGVELNGVNLHLEKEPEPAGV